jgi:hypothetical protein
MPSKPHAKTDAPASAAPIVKGVLDVSRCLDHLQKDVELLRARIHAGDGIDRIEYAALSAQLFASELVMHLTRLQITMADEGAD